MMKKLLITGGSGFIGQTFIQTFSSQYNITIVSRTKQANAITWRELTKDMMQSFDVVINLAGENIGAKRWTPKQKQAILKSRVEATKTIANLIAQCEQPPFLINASAVGIYPAHYNVASSTVYDESQAVKTANNFLQEVALAWEAALKPVAHLPHAVTRFAVVLGKGGMLKKLLPSFKLGLGAVIGSGAQGLPWVHVSDLVRALDFIIENQLRGVFNIVAPEQINQKTFAKTLAHALKRPCFLPMPAWVVTLLFGQMGRELLLSGQQVSGDKLHQQGFKYALSNLLMALIKSV